MSSSHCSPLGGNFGRGGDVVGIYVQVISLMFGLFSLELQTQKQTPVVFSNFIIPSCSPLAIAFGSSETSRFCLVIEVMWASSGNFGFF